MECFPSFSSPAPDPLAFLQKRVKKRESGAATYFALLPPRLDADNLLPTCQRFKLPRRTRRFSGAPQQEGQATGFCSRGGATGNSQVDSSVCKSGSATDSHWACGQTNGLCLSRLQNSWSNVEGNPVYTPRLQPLPSMYPPPEDVWAKWRSERENALIQKRSACSGHTATVCQKYLVEPTRGVQTPKPQDPRGHLTFLPAKGAPPFRNFPFDESNVNNPAYHEGENHRPPSSAARIRTATIWEAHKQRALLTRQKVEPLQFSLKKDSGEVTRVSTSCGESHQPALERFLPNGEATQPPKALKVDRRDRNVLESLASWYKMRYEKMEVHEPFYSSHRASEFANRDAEDAESEREENNFLPQTWADFVREPTPSHSPCRVTEASVGHSAFRPPASPRSSALKRTEAEARSRAFLPSSRRIRNGGEARGADKGEGDTPEGMRGESVEVGASSAFRGLSREAAHDPVAYEKQQTKVLDRFALSAENCGISLYRDSPHSHLVPGYWRQKAGDTPASQSPHCRAAASPSPVHLQLYGCVSPRPPSSCVVLSSSTCLTPRSVSAPPTASSFRYASFLHSTAAMSPLTQHSLPLAFAKPRLSSPPVNAPYRWRPGSSVHAPSVQKRRLLAYVGPVTFSSPWKSHFEKKSGSGIEEKKIEKPVTGQGAVQLDHFFRLRSLRLPVDTAEQILRSPEETCDSWASLSMHIPLCLHSNPKDIFIRSKKRWRTSLAQGDMNGNREEIHKFRNGIRVEKGEESHAEENLVHRHQPNEKVYRVRIEPEDSDEDRTRMELNLRSFSHALRELAGELPSPKTSVSRGEKPHAEKGGQEEEDEQRESSSATRNEAVAGRKDYSDEANSACDGPNSKALLRIKPTSHMRPETQTRTSQESWILRYGFRGAMSLDQTRQNHFHHLVEPVRTEQRGHSWRQRVAVASPLSGARRLEVSGILGALRSPCAFEGRLSPNTEVSSRSSPCRTCLEGTKQDRSGRAMGTQLATSTRTESFRRRAESRRDKREDEETCGEREETDAWVENEKDKGKMRGFGAGDNRDQGRQNLAGSGEEEGTGGEETRRDRRRDVSICRSNASHAKTYLQATSDFLLLSSYESLSSCLSTFDCAPSTAGDIGAQTPGKNRVTSRGDGGAAVLDSLDWPVGSEEVACTRGDGRQRKEGTENKSRGEPGEREGDEAEGDGESMSVLLGERQRHCASERSDASASPEKKRRLLPLPAFLR
uniref:Uncharacterized protein n=1 Tax=Toxoplasma gondii (strain ATCC 50861 / VEG) TaxID=432359 RepID=A0A0F7VB72_TOXGV|nr:TPA: hypothetical protein BN1205_093945 [Toxoplasma gondii VEG]